MSKSIQGKHGMVYLWEKVSNVWFGEREQRMMTSGLHVVVDMYCVGCGSLVGLKYEATCDKNQKYKEGRFILKRFKVLVPEGSSHVVNQEDSTDDGDRRG